MTAATDTTETSARFAISIKALPPLPATAQQILTCFGDEFIDAAKVADVVENDAGICAKLLGLANSAYFGISEPINDIGAAISRVLGVDTVRSLVLAMAVQQSFDSKRCPAFDAERFWLKSLAVAETCKKIAALDQSADDEERDLAYTTGLCHNLGLMALAHVDPVRTGRALLEHSEQHPQRSLADVLEEGLHTNHRTMTVELARAWSLPAPMLTAYQSRANMGFESDARLNAVVAAGIMAVNNAGLAEDQQESLSRWSECLDIDAAELQKTAIMGSRQQDRFQSLASRLTR